MVLAIAGMPLSGQTQQGATDWPNYGGDTGHMEYSPLKQITPQNVHRLHAWRYKTGDKRAGEWENTPLVVNGVMYAETGKQRVLASVTAHDANTGRLLRYYQTVHHDIFDADLCAAPTLVDITLLLSIA